MPVELAAHGHGEWNVEALIGHFVDAGWAIASARADNDTIVVTLEQDGGDASGNEGAGARILSQAMRFPAGWPLERETPERLGLTAHARARARARVRLARWNVQPRDLEQTPGVRRARPRARLRAKR